MKKFYQKHHDVFVGFGTVIAIVLAFLAALLFFSIRWLLRTWSELTVDEIIYHLVAPLQGTSAGMVNEYIKHCAIPSGLIVLVVTGLFFVTRKRRAYSLVVWLSVLGSFFTTGFTVADAWKDLDLGEYLKSQFEVSTFIDDHYVDPKTLELKFPEKKRNLLYIFMESTEITFTDKANGGGKTENMIPELTQLAQANEDFSGNDPVLEGGYAMPGATWTMGAMFAQTSGLPLKISIEKNSMDSQKTFFPEIQTIGDILQKEGYKQKLMLGSVGYFGGRKLYFQTHGNYDIEDFSYWKNKGKFPSNYWVNWGFEDRKLYEYAKEELTSLGKGDQPFNLTMLTVDTHFPNGYLCPLCGSKFDEQYANVYACASKQLSDFIDWCKKQPWYENTTIVISGDHPTMDHNFCNDIANDYVRKVYTCYVNPAATVEKNERREYSTFDDFPTTLAAMGVEIPGNRLGLGTNLFSAEPTLTEQYGRENEKAEIEKKSKLMIKLAAIDQAAAFEAKEKKEAEDKKKKAEKEAAAKKAEESKAAVTKKQATASTTSVKENKNS